MRVFISYCDNDGLQLAQKAAVLLEKYGHEVWYYDRNKTPGIPRVSDITRNIEACRVIMMLWTEGSNSSRGQEKEIILWDIFDKILIVLPIDEVTVRMEIAGYNYERLRSSTFESEFEDKIASNLTHIVRRIIRLSGMPIVGVRGRE